MKLEDIGFYTLSNRRAKEVAGNPWNTDLQRCEIILTDRCNFNCPYCRGVKDNYTGDMVLQDILKVIDIWDQGKIKNIRFSGGEPTLHPDLKTIIKYTKQLSSIERIALSTNGSANLYYYKELINLGVNDLSISLDACCAATADIMTGIKGKFNIVTSNIKELSKITYVTVGVVLNSYNTKELEEIIKYAEDLGVSDIRIIPSAQSNHKLKVESLTNRPILNYRLNNIKTGKHVRGIQKTDCNKCHLVKNDMTVLKGYHFPCIIYMREQGNPIGKIVGDNIDLEYIMQERKRWFESHNPKTHPICNKNCLDVCVDYNNKVEKFINGKERI